MPLCLFQFCLHFYIVQIISKASACNVIWKLAFWNGVWFPIDIVCPLHSTWLHFDEVIWLSAAMLTKYEPATTRTHVNSYFKLSERAHPHNLVAWWIDGKNCCAVSFNFAENKIYGTCRWCAFFQFQPINRAMMSSFLFFVLCQKHFVGYCFEFSCIIMSLF